MKNVQGRNCPRMLCPNRDFVSRGCYQISETVCPDTFKYQQQHETETDLIYPGTFYSQWCSGCSRISNDRYVKKHACPVFLPLYEIYC